MPIFLLELEHFFRGLPVAFMAIWLRPNVKPSKKKKLNRRQNSIPQKGTFFFDPTFFAGPMIKTQSDSKKEPPKTSLSAQMLCIRAPENVILPDAHQTASVFRPTRPAALAGLGDFLSICTTLPGIDLNGASKCLFPRTRSSKNSPVAKIESSKGVFNTSKPCGHHFEWENQANKV